MKGSAMPHMPVGEERRDLSLADAAMAKAVADDTADERFTGHAAVFGQRAAIGNRPAGDHCELGDLGVRLAGADYLAGLA